MTTNTCSDRVTRLLAILAIAAFGVITCDGSESPSKRSSLSKLETALDSNATIGDRIAAASELNDAELEALQTRLLAGLSGSLEKDAIYLLGQIGDERHSTRWMRCSELQPPPSGPDPVCAGPPPRFVLGPLKLKLPLIRLWGLTIACRLSQS